jgi:hypothetical protein
MCDAAPIATLATGLPVASVAIGSTDLADTADHTATVVVFEDHRDQAAGLPMPSDTSRDLRHAERLQATEAQSGLGDDAETGLAVKQPNSLDQASGFQRG